MAYEFLLPAFLAVALLIAAGGFELIRIERRGADCLSIFWVIFALQCLIPLALVAVLYLFSPNGLRSDNEFFDRVYSVAGWVELSIVACFAAISLAVTYAAYGLVLERLRPSEGNNEQRLIRINIPVYLSVVGLGLLSGAVLLRSFGGGLLDGYQSLVLFRNQDQSIERGFLNANLFSLTQTFLFIAMLGPFVTGRGDRVSRLWPAWLPLILIFALLAVSRRAVLIPIVFALFVLMLKSGRLRILPLALLAAAVAPVIVFGKTLLAFLAGQAAEPSFDPDAAVKYLLLLASDAGITIVESLATLSLIDLPYRLGIDHLFSALRRIPSGTMGYESHFLPDRIVRHTTEVFLAKDALDIPPGWFGQMWLDFGIFGPIVYGILVGTMLGWVEAKRRSFVNDWHAAAFFSLVAFMFALPVNTGSLDYIFSVDIIALGLLVALFVRTRSRGGAVLTAAAP